MFFVIHNRNHVIVFKNHLLGHSRKASLQTSHCRFCHNSLSHSGRKLISHITHGHNPNNPIILRHNRKTNKVSPFNQILKIFDCHFWSHIVVVFSSSIDLSDCFNICFDTNIRKCLVNHSRHSKCIVSSDHDWKLLQTRKLFNPIRNLKASSYQNSIIVFEG